MMAYCIYKCVLFNFQHDEKITSLEARETQLLAETAVVNDQSETLEQKDAEISALR